MHIPNPGKQDVSQDKCLEGLSAFAIWWYIQVINVKSALRFLVFYKVVSIKFFRQKLKVIKRG